MIILKSSLLPSEPRIPRAGHLCILSRVNIESCHVSPKPTSIARHHVSTIMSLRPLCHFIANMPRKLFLGVGTGWPKSLILPKSEPKPVIQLYDDNININNHKLASGQIINQKTKTKKNSYHTIWLQSENWWKSQ